MCGVEEPTTRLDGRVSYSLTRGSRPRCLLLERADVIDRMPSLGATQLQNEPTCSINSTGTFCYEPWFTTLSLASKLAPGARASHVVRRKPLC